MLKSINDVHEGFFSFFLPSVVVGSLEIPTIYARKSKKSNRSKPIESYPRIVILDGSINPGKDWRPNEQKLYFVDDEDNTIETKDPLQLVFEYQVSAYFENTMDKFSFINWVFQNFRAFGFLKFPDGTDVNYKMVQSDLERQDGIFEVHLNFTLEPLVYLEKETVVDLIEEYNITANKETITLKV